MRIVISMVTIAALTGVFLFGSFTGPDPLQAQAGDLQVLSHRVENEFPDRVRFFLEAAGPDEITEARVIFKTIGQVTRSSHRKVELTPGNHISGEAELLTGATSYLPPGTRMAYSFEISDNAGRTVRTDEEIFVYLDNRFEWFSVSQGIITVYYNNPSVQRRAEHVLETAVAALRRMGPVLGINPELPLHIVTYHNYGDMAGALPFRSQTTSEQLRTSGMAFDKERVLMVHSGSRSVTATTAHEFVHLLVGDATGTAYGQVPAWLNEGLAEFGNLQGEEDVVLNDTVRYAINNGKLRPLWHQARYSGSPEDILIAYGHGESVVTYLIITYGEEKMADLMQAITRTLNIDRALMEVYGLDQYALDSNWRRQIGLDPLPRPEQASKRPRPTARPTLAPVGAQFPFPAATAVPAAVPATRETPDSGSLPSDSEPVEPLAETQSATPTPAAALIPSVATAEPMAIVPAAPGEGPSGEEAVSPGREEEPDSGGLLSDNTEPVEPPAEAQPAAPDSGGCAPLLAGNGRGELGMLTLLLGPLGLLAAARLGRKNCPE